MKRLLLLLLTAATLRADVALPAIFSERAVLLRAERVPVWGKAAPGEAVAVSLGSARASTTAAQDGRWRLELDLSTAPKGPLELVVQGRNRIVAKDVVVGEVWLCSGQSNMEWPLTQAAGYADELKRPPDRSFRQFRVKKVASPLPLDDVEGEWVVAASASIGEFSGVGYFFGRRLRDELQAPVGLINSSYGGTHLESWTSAEALDSDSRHKSGKDRALKAWNDRERYKKEFQAWVVKTGRQDRAAGAPELFALPETATSDWKPISLPGAFGASGLPEAGAVWIRRSIQIKPEQAGKNLDLFLGDLRGANAVYWNGQRIGASDHFAFERRYTIRGNLVQAGEATLAVRVFNPVPGMGIAPGETRFRFGGNQSLAGEWLAKVEYASPPLDAAAREALPARPEGTGYTEPNVAGFLFNGMIHPIVPYALRGVLWYQGENNWNKGFQYRSGFPLLINDWRARWARPDLPFYFCQLPNHQAREKAPGQSWWAELREAQALALALPRTGQAVLIDVGDEGDIHPSNKKDPGERIARLALADTYRREVVASGPVFAGVSIEGAKARIRFQASKSALVARPLPAEYRPVAKDPRAVPLQRNRPDSQLEGFAICGEDRKWVWADAKIEGESVVVWSDDVPKPTAVRYAWAQNPIVNLYNDAGLPAAPFRTDDFPLMSANAKY